LRERIFRDDMLFAALRWPRSIKSARYCERVYCPHARLALFTRETQSLSTCTLARRKTCSGSTALRARHLQEFMLHYNFPPFSVGEVKFLRVLRREIATELSQSRSCNLLRPTPNSLTIRCVSTFSIERSLRWLRFAAARSH